MFKFGWGPRSDKKETVSDSRRSKSYAADRARGREVSEDSETWSGSDDGRNRRHPSYRKSSRRRDGSGKSSLTGRPRQQTGERRRSASDNYHSSSSSLKSRGRAPSGDANRMNDTLRSPGGRPGFSDSRSNLPYPGFSKAHSREAPSSKEDLGTRSPYTPTHTDIGQQRSPNKHSPGKAQLRDERQAPPSPPLTAAFSNLRRPKSTSNVVKDAHSLLGTQRSASTKAETPRNSNSPSPTRKLRFSASRASLRAAEEGVSSANISPMASNTRVASVGATHPTQHAPSIDVGDPNHSPSRRARTDTLRTFVPSPVSGSEATSVTATRDQAVRDGTIHSQGRSFTSNQTARLGGPPRTRTSPKETHSPNVRTPADQNMSGNRTPLDENVTAPIANGTSAQFGPPPPPPPGLGSAEPPKVDYLLPHGGLPNQVTTQFSLAPIPPAPHTYQQYPPPQPTFPPIEDLAIVFSPYANLLDSYEEVLQKKGSLAMATGYESVASRLVRRLETVFSRDMSLQQCTCAMCAMCRANPTESPRTSEDDGVSWGGVLDLISGQSELPQWPPFAMPNASLNTSFDGMRIETPMQKLDIDVPEEYREHYVRQSRKTKNSVDKWLASQPEDHSAPPTEVDDETLIFAMLTYLPHGQRTVFTALIRGLPNVPDSRAPTPLSSSVKSALLSKVAIALQRLYHLGQPPRAPESAMFLLQNPTLHDALATLSTINPQEWDVLVSGRFDEFLASGAGSQTLLGGSAASRGPTPFAHDSPRDVTPFRNPATFGPNGHLRTRISISNGSTPTEPIQTDDDVEVAVLGEIEREIFQGMERLEDALEALHLRAEGIRSALIERSAGLSMQAQQRRAGPEELRAVMGTPFTGFGYDDTEWVSASAAPSRPVSTAMNGHRWDEDDGMDDAMSLAPDDSASNLGFRERRRRHRLRREHKSGSRRTPAPVREEDEI